MVSVRSHIPLSYFLSVHVLRIAFLYCTKITSNKKQHSPYIPSLTTAEAINQSQFVPPPGKLKLDGRVPGKFPRLTALFNFPIWTETAVLRVIDHDP